MVPPTLREHAGRANDAHYTDKMRDCLTPEGLLVTRQVRLNDDASGGIATRANHPEFPNGEVSRPPPLIAAH